jgi:hypothetical protein
MADPQKGADEKRERFWLAAEINSMIKSGRSAQAIKALNHL